MSIEIESEELKFREEANALIKFANYNNASFLTIGNENRTIGIKKADPDRYILTEAIERYVVAKINRAKAQDKADKIEMLNGLLNELAGDSNLVLMTRESEPVES